MICVVYVTYEPNFNLLRRSIESISNQVEMVILIDNSIKNNEVKFFESVNVKVFNLGQNIGIAAAQNIGIKKSIELGAEYIVLSDQDTTYPPDYVKKMLAVFNKYEDIAAVAPKFIDSQKKSVDGFISLTPVFFKQFFPPSGLHEVLQAIASGKVIKTSVLSKVGLMDADLFIDWVDLEWCWRARAAGFKIIGNADVAIQHQLGDGSVDIGFREVNLRSPMRHYYITRNAFYLALYSKVLDVPHRINLFFRSFRYIVGFPVLAKPRLKNLKAVTLGFYHGVTGRLGKVDL